MQTQCPRLFGSPFQMQGALCSLLDGQSSDFKPASRVSSSNQCTTTIRTRRSLVNLFKPPSQKTIGKGKARRRFPIKSSLDDTSGFSSEVGALCLSKRSVALSIHPFFTDTSRFSSETRRFCESRTDDAGSGLSYRCCDTRSEHTCPGRDATVQLPFDAWLGEGSDEVYYLTHARKPPPSVLRHSL